MKKIGYIYRYNENEKKGILVYGNNGSDHIGSYVKYKPIKFTDNDCISKVKTGQLVYFYIDESLIASKIERASLQNFRRDIMYEITSIDDSKKRYEWQELTTISFENLSDPYLGDNFSFSKDMKFNFTPVGQLPESIDELFALFGAKKHYGFLTGDVDILDSPSYNDNSLSSINILDIEHWIDKDFIENKNYYGTTAEEIIDLFNLFVKKEMKLFNNRDKSISSSWSILLSQISHYDLNDICIKEPMLQPALPDDFCLKNLNNLSIDYGFPNVSVCEQFFRERIKATVSTRDYLKISSMLSSTAYGSVNCKKGTGVFPCMLENEILNELSNLMEIHFQTKVYEEIIKKLYSLSKGKYGSGNRTPYLKNKNYIICLGKFVDTIEKLESELNYRNIDDLMEIYKELANEDKMNLKDVVTDVLIEYVKKLAKSSKIFVLRVKIEKFSIYFDEKVIEEIYRIVNSKHTKITDLKELNYAFSGKMISENQYLIRYKQLTKNFNVEELIGEINAYGGCLSNGIPASLQSYLLGEIFIKYDVRSLETYKYIKTEYGSINNLRELLKWLNDNKNLDKELLSTIITENIRDLSKEERWALFIEGLISSPLYDNIREQLDIIYKNKRNKLIANKDLFKYSCFQDVMLSDVDSIEDPEIILFIADNLDETHQYMMQQKASGFLKLYLWQKHPSGNFDWDLIKTYLYELSANAQIRVLRYIFGKMASGDVQLSLDDLYSEFVETNTPACSAICGILFMLKAKKNDMNVSITPSMLESVIGKEDEPYTFLKDTRDIFYPCNGYLAISANKQDIDYQTFYGFLTKEVKNDELYYVIHFYDSPVDLFGRTIDWLIDSDYVETAKQVLIKNTNVEIIEGKFYIHESLEYFVKQFVIAYDIDDKCGLVSNKEWMIEQGYLPRNNAYQPLYTNYIRIYDESDYYVCRCGSCGGSDPHNNIPFFWCNKKMCVRRAHFLQPPSQWEKYHFADLLFIALGQSSEVRESVWHVNSEISQFICDYKHVSNSDEKNICSKPLNETEERGTWDESSSIYREIYDDEDDDEYNEDYEDYSPDQDEPTYDRYNGSYAQDVMGYSDDDIDTIFDGDPDAYWNID